MINADTSFANQSILLKLIFQIKKNQNISLHISLHVEDKPVDHHTIVVNYVQTLDTQIKKSQSA